MIKPRIMIVEDEPALASVIQDYLQRSHMESDILTDGTHAVEAILSSSPDLVILDVMLPGKDGLSICKEVRAHSDVPIILETAKIEEIDRLLGLELGADDYICKPWSPRELVARVKTILRRVNLQNKNNEIQSDLNGLIVDSETWSVTFDAAKVDLTRREFQVLDVLYRRPGRVFSRSQLLEMAFPNDATVFDRT
ncbi:MAG: response regulator, partial [Pseudomonadota bacterium]